MYALVESELPPPCRRPVRLAGAFGPAHSRGRSPRRWRSSRSSSFGRRRASSRETQICTCRGMLCCHAFSRRALFSAAAATRQPARATPAAMLPADCVVRRSSRAHASALLGTLRTTSTLGLCRRTYRSSTASTGCTHAHRRASLAWSSRTTCAMLRHVWIPPSRYSACCACVLWWRVRRQSDSNQLTGVIPSTFGQLTRLYVL